jgi:peptide/nickel transport system substrate-binding protein
MLKRGEVDLATLMQGVFYEDVKKDPKLRLLMVQSPTLWIVNFGSQWDPKSPWSDPRVRKAASLAIDRQTLADVHAPGCDPVGQLGLDTDPSALRLSPDPYDPEQAKKLLAEAGYPKGFNGGKFYPYEGGYWPYGEQVANYWKAIGISMETVLLDRPAIQASRASGKFKGSVFIETIFHSTIGLRMSYLLDWNILGSYPDIQALWDQYKRETSAKGRKDLIGNIQKMIHERSMFIPLTSTNSPAAVGPRVKGTPYKVQPFLWFPAPFEDIELNS